MHDALLTYDHSWVERMRSRLTWFFLGFWICATPTTIQGDGCHKAPSIIEVNETAPRGTELYRTEKSNVRWRLNVADTKDLLLDQFVKLTKKGTLPETYYVLWLLQSMDLELMRDSYGLTDPAYILVLYCMVPGMGEETNHVVLGVTPVNEFSPTFTTSNIVVSVEEGVKDVTLVDLSQWVTDKDMRMEKKEIQRYGFLEPKSPMLRVYTHNGKVTVKTPLDYEALPADQKYLSLTVAAWDAGDIMASTNFTVNVINVDDLPPRFTYEGCPDPCDSVAYGVQITLINVGLLSEIKPAEIHAEDADGLGAKIIYSISNGPDGYEDFIKIDPTTADVSIIKPLLEMNKTLPVVIMIKAEEDTPKQRRSVTTLILTTDEWPPKAPNDARPLYLVEATAIFHVILILLVVATFLYCGRRWRQKSLPWNAEEFKEYQLSVQEAGIKKEEDKEGDKEDDDKKEEEGKAEIPRTQSEFEKFRKRVASTTL